MQKEPTVIISSIVGAIEALIVVGIAFGLPVSNEQLGLIIAALTSVATAVSAILIRARVFAPATVEAVAANVAASYDQGITD